MRETRNGRGLGTDPIVGNETHPVEYSPFFGIEKGLVLQESRVFHDSHLDSRKCQQVITKLLYLINQGESLTKVRELTRVMSWISTQHATDEDG